MSGVISNVELHIWHEWKTGEIVLATAHLSKILRLHDCCRQHLTMIPNRGLRPHQLSVAASKQLLSTRPGASRQVSAVRSPSEGFFRYLVQHSFARALLFCIFSITINCRPQVMRLINSRYSFLPCRVIDLDLRYQAARVPSEPQAGAPVLPFTPSFSFLHRRFAMDHGMHHGLGVVLARRMFHSKIFIQPLRPPRPSHPPTSPLNPPNPS